mmetsp:Transcript_23672/g.70995  ORF Transcript_23672/g.70995 Transcript_23672/m.70995 type:complete len:244 (+) Transcript_23672:599-1330(+)
MRRRRAGRRGAGLCGRRSEPPAGGAREPSAHSGRAPEAPRRPQGGDGLAAAAARRAGGAPRRPPRARRGLPGAERRARGRTPQRVGRRAAVTLLRGARRPEGPGRGRAVEVAARAGRAARHGRPALAPRLGAALPQFNSFAALRRQRLRVPGGSRKPGPRGAGVRFGVGGLAGGARRRRRARVSLRAGHRGAGGLPDGPPRRARGDRGPARRRDAGVRARVVARRRELRGRRLRGLQSACAGA